MTLRSLFTVFVTPRLTEARDFYVDHFGFHVVFEADWYLQLHGSRGDASPPLELAFMRPDVEGQPGALQQAFAGAGAFLTIEVEDVTAEHDRLVAAGVLSNLIVPLRDEAWGQRHFVFRDPAGTFVDVVQPIPPAAEFAAAYAAQVE